MKKLYVYNVCKHECRVCVGTATTICGASSATVARDTAIVSMNTNRNFHMPYSLVSFPMTLSDLSPIITEQTRCYCCVNIFV